MIKMDIEKFKHKIPIKIRFSDLDAMGHVNNAKYLSFLEEARLAYYEKVLNVSLRNLNFNAIVARIEIDYLSPIQFGDKVEIYTRTSNIGNKSSDVDHLIVVNKKTDKIIAARAFTKLVAYDYKINQTIPVSEDARKAVEYFEGRK
jgi:acyl-CoA thioester hydrolase